MNAERLESIIEFLIAAEDKFTIQQRLAELQATVTNMVFQIPLMPAISKKLRIH
jgi:hypothetical protein